MIETKGRLMGCRSSFLVVSLGALASVGAVAGCGGTVETVEVEGGAAAGDSVELLRFDGATGPSMSLALMMARNLHPSTGIDGLSGFDGTSMAMAAARERVMVTWLNGTQLGYALLRCAP